MSSPITMEDLVVKYESSIDNVLISQVVIWQTPQGSLYRVEKTGEGFEVSTLVNVGWISLITLSISNDDVEDTAAALEVWLGIQNQPADEDRPQNV